MSKQYFTPDTEAAIVRYNTSNDPIEKSKIYGEEIHYAFFKLTQNIIHTFKFHYTDIENIEDLQHEVITFLLSKIHRFDPNNGAKAYSYFGTITKRWLILYNENNYKKKINSVPVASLEEDDSHSYIIDEHNSPSDKLSDNDKISFFMDLYIEYCSSNIYTLFPKEIEAKTADAILELFRKRDNINIFNKKALYIYIKEMVPEVKTPKITKIADKLYTIYKSSYINYLNNGIIKFNNM